MEVVGQTHPALAYDRRGYGASWRMRVGHETQATSRREQSSAAGFPAR